MKVTKFLLCIFLVVASLNINLRVSSGGTLPQGYACTTGTECLSGYCADGYCCNAACNGGVCDACSIALGAVADGVCTFINGVLCSDGNACTGSDICQSGTCMGQTVVDCGPAPDQCHNTPTCNPATGACSATNKTNGTDCNDDNLCTTGETCQTGVCTGNPVICPSPDQCHTGVTCDRLTGLCPALPAKADGTSCNDSSACTMSDTCQSGVCTGTNPVVCPAPDQCHAPGVCNTTTGVCSSPAKANGTDCNDAIPCTTGETCQNGACTGGTAVVCTAPDQCHLAGNCDFSTGICVDAPARGDGTTCNDGNACTQADTCQSGVCTGGNPVVCSALDQCHIAGTCDPVDGCSNPATPFFKIAGGSMFGAASVKLAYDTVQNGDALQIQAVDFSGHAVLQQDKAVNILGGYECDFLSNPGLTGISGSLTIDKGTVTIEHLFIE